MRRRLLALTAMLVLTVLASWAPQAEAVAYCSASYCAGKPASTKCGCPPGTDRRGQASTCGAWTGIYPGCWWAP